LNSNYHVLKDATQVRLVAREGVVDAKVVQVDAANDLALLKADWRFAPLRIASSRTVALGGTVATVGFPDPAMRDRGSRPIPQSGTRGKPQLGSRTSTGTGG